MTDKTLQDRLREWKGSTITVAIAAQEAADALDAQEARIKALEGALRESVDLAEFWINREDRREMSEVEYNTWLSLGFRSSAMIRARALLGEK